MATVNCASRRIPLLSYGSSRIFGKFESCETIRFYSSVPGVCKDPAAGESSTSDQMVTVFGATGFLGRYVVQQLVRLGSQVFVPYRKSLDVCKHLQVMGRPGQVVPLKLDVRDDESVGAAITQSNTVVNMIGRDYESFNFSFDEVNVGIPERISRLAREHGGIRRYVHVSAIGANHESRAPQYRTKAAGEDVTLSSFPEATILRPAHMIGTEDRLLNRWARFAKTMPVVPIIGDGSNRFQPAHVNDVASAVVAVVKGDSSCAGKTYELGGPDVYTVNELVSLVYETIGEEAKTLHIPFSLAKQIALQIEDLTKSIPNPSPKQITFSQNNIRSLRSHYCVSPAALTFRDLGINPRKLVGDAIAYLHHHRT